MIIRPQPIVLAFTSRPPWHQSAQLLRLKLHVVVVRLLAIVVVLVTPAALNVQSLAVGAVLQKRPLRSVKLPCTAVVTILTPAALTVHSLALCAALERPPGPAFSAAGRQPPRRPCVSPSFCCTMRAGCWWRVSATPAVRPLSPMCRLVWLWWLLRTVQARSRRLRANARLQYSTRHLLFTRNSFTSTTQLACLFSVLSQITNAATALYHHEANLPNLKETGKGSGAVRVSASRRYTEINDNMAVQNYRLILVINL